jgi:hypothetical protein
MSMRGTLAAVAHRTSRHGAARPAAAGQRQPGGHITRCPNARLAASPPIG